jgi:hypothetical protein
MGLIRLAVSTAKYAAVAGATAYIVSSCPSSAQVEKTATGPLSADQYRSRVVELYRQSDTKYDNGTSILLDILKEEGREKGRMLYDKLNLDKKVMSDAAVH